MSNLCTYRVPDHTDFVNCDEPVERDNRCRSHIEIEAAQIRLRLRELSVERNTLEARLRVILGVSESD